MVASLAPDEESGVNTGDPPRNSMRHSACWSGHRDTRRRSRRLNRRRTKCQSAKGAVKAGGLHLRDAAGPRLYIPRRGGDPTRNQTRLTISTLDTLEPVGEIDGIGGNGAAVDPKSGHGFTSSEPVSMLDTKMRN